MTTRTKTMNKQDDIEVVTVAPTRRRATRKAAGKNPVSRADKNNAAGRKSSATSGNNDRIKRTAGSGGKNSVKSTSVKDVDRNADKKTLRQPVRTDKKKDTGKKKDSAISVMDSTVPSDVSISAGGDDRKNMIGSGDNVKSVDNVVNIDDNIDDEFGEDEKTLVTTPVVSGNAITAPIVVNIGMAGSDDDYADDNAILGDEQDEMDGNGAMTFPSFPASTSTEFHFQKSLYTNEEFKKKDIGFRVGAILSDGQWYTADKIRLWAKEHDLDEIQPILDEMIHDDAAILGPNGVSYRMSLKQMEEWRHKNGMAMDAQPIPKLIYPRVFGHGANRMTEVEMFECAPLHQVSILTFMLKDPSKIDDIKRDLGYLGKFKEMPGAPGKYQLYSLSNSVTKKVMLRWELDHGKEGSVFVKGRFTSNNSSRRREIVEMNSDAVNGFISFYTQFAKYLVPSVKRTLNVYIAGGMGSGAVTESRETVLEGDKVISEWILSLMQSYDEQRCTPFSYILQVQLPRKSYDYSSKKIGIELNKFQIEKNRAIKRLNAAVKNAALNAAKTSKDMIEDTTENMIEADASLSDIASDVSSAITTIAGSVEEKRDKVKKIVRDVKEGQRFDNETIFKEIRKGDSDLKGITLEEYEDMDASLKTWQKSYSTKSLDWSETGEEKMFKQSSANNSFLEDIERRSEVHHAVILAAMRTGDVESEELIFNALASDSIASAMMSGKINGVTDGFRDALAQCLAEVRHKTL